MKIPNLLIPVLIPHPIVIVPAIILLCVLLYEGFK